MSEKLKYHIEEFNDPEFMKMTSAHDKWIAFKMQEDVNKVEAEITTSMQHNPWCEQIVERYPDNVTRIALGKKSLWTYLLNKYRLWKHKGIAPWVR
jgi:hypothetical protein